MLSGNITTLRCTEVLGGDVLLLFSHDVRGPNPGALNMQVNDEQRFGPAILCAPLAVVQLPILYFFPLPAPIFLYPSSVLFALSFVRLALRVLEQSQKLSRRTRNTSN
jgi:hypothetical protein